MAQPEPQAQESPADRVKAYRWPKGVSGNPGGRPKTKEVTLESALRERFKRDPHLMTQIIDALVKEVKAGSPAHLKILAERVGGAVGLNVYDREEQVSGAAGATKTVLFNDEADEDDDDGPNTDLPGA